MIHNHPNNSPASFADLGGAAWLAAELLIVVGSEGDQHIYARRGDEFEALAPIHNPDIVAPVDPLETAVDSIAYWIQTLREIGNPPEMVMRQGELTADDIPLGLTAAQALHSVSAYAALAYGEKFNSSSVPSHIRQSVIADWKSDWFENPESWIDFDAIERRLPIIKEAVERWYHPGSGMSKDEFAALLIANLHQEAHYRRQEPTVDKMSPGEFGLNLVDIFGTYFENQAASVAGHFDILPGTLPHDPTVGPANLRIQVADEMLGTGIIPTPNGKPLEFDDRGRLDHLERQWQSLETAVERRRFLENDVNAIELIAANLNRGVERLIDRDLQSTMFNLSAWLSQGIAESHTLRTNQDNKSVTDAINHAHATVPFVSAILHHYEAFELKASSDGFIVFNDDDLHALLKAEQ